MKLGLAQLSRLRAQLKGSAEAADTIFIDTAMHTFRSNFTQLLISYPLSFLPTLPAANLPTHGDLIVVIRTTIDPRRIVGAHGILSRWVRIQIILRRVLIQGRWGVERSNIQTRDGRILVRMVISLTSAGDRGCLLISVVGLHDTGDFLCHGLVGEVFYLSTRSAILFQESDHGRFPTARVEGLGLPVFMILDKDLRYHVLGGSHVRDEGLVWVLGELGKSIESPFKDCC